MQRKRKSLVFIKKCYDNTLFGMKNAFLGTKSVFFGTKNMVFWFRQSQKVTKEMLNFN